MCGELVYVEVYVGASLYDVRQHHTIDRVDHGNLLITLACRELEYLLDRANGHSVRDDIAVVIALALGAATPQEDDTD